MFSNLGHGECSVQMLVMDPSRLHTNPSGLSQVCFQIYFVLGKACLVSYLEEPVLDLFQSIQIGPETYHTLFKRCFPNTSPYVAHSSDRSLYLFIFSISDFRLFRFPSIFSSQP